MKLRLDQLKSHLEKTLSRVYLVFGDEALFIQEACQLIRKAARKQGFSERNVFYADHHFQWQQLHECAASYSLFSDKTLIELRLPSGKPGDKGSKQLQAYCTHLPEDKILLMQCEKLESANQRSKWFKAIMDVGTVIQVWPLQTKDLPAWIRQRALAKSMRLSSQAVALIADRVEGNLLAAKQEIEKLYILYGEKPINEAEVIHAVVDSTRYNIFQLVDEALNGRLKRCTQIVSGLKQEGVEPILILWALARDIRTLALAAQQLNTGLTAEQALNSLRVWPKRRPLFKIALQKHSLNDLHSMLQHISRIDQMIKGLKRGQIWTELLILVARLVTGRYLSHAPIYAGQVIE